MAQAIIITSDPTFSVGDDVKSVLDIQADNNGRVEVRSEPGSDKFMRLVVDTQLTKFVQCVGCKMTIALSKEMPVEELNNHACIRPKGTDDAKNAVTIGYRVDWIQGKSASGMTLMVDGFTFQRHHKNSEIQSWRCSKYFPNKCMSKAYTNGRWLIKPVTCDHNHEPGDMTCLRAESNQAFLVTPSNDDFSLNDSQVEAVCEQIDTENMEPSAFENFDEEDDVGIHEIEWVPSRNGSNRLTLCIDGHHFHRDVDRNGLQTWKCSQHRSHKCKVRTATRDDQLVRPVTGVHTHGREPARQRKNFTVQLAGQQVVEDGSDYETPGFEMVMSEDDNSSSPGAVTIATEFQYQPNSVHTINTQIVKAANHGTSILAKNSCPNVPIDHATPPKYAVLLSDRDIEITKLKQDNERLRGELTLKNATINRHESQLNELKREKEKELETLKRSLTVQTNGVDGSHSKLIIKRICTENDVDQRASERELNQMKSEAEKLRLEIAHLKGQVQESDKWKSLFQNKTITMT
ncbi:hypothetical protein HDE_07925 [Halotydeus destructor]|nr:hypothetical protein HDE_07925 [Halotydeus destructor]